MKAYPYSYIYNDVVKVERYWNRLKPENYTTALYEEKWRMLTSLFEQISSQNYVLILIYNVINNRFVYEVDKRNVVGHDAALYLAADGIDFTMSNVRPDFLTATLLVNQKAFEYSNISKEIKNKIVSSFDGMYKKSDGDYIHFLQQGVCLEADNNGNVVLLLNYIQDITYLKKEKTANLIITAPNDFKWWNFNFDNNLLEPVQPLTKQEKIILASLAQGKSSKNIAKELFISSHTIDTHRRNLLNKTNCIDTTGLITYAKLVGLL